uniref:C2H2-type domain-containing protein n=1 Tax=Pseudonaja textilis TaxID=8673 RepID=A0A670Z9K0_PSETE
IPWENQRIAKPRACGQNFARKAFLTEHHKMHSSEKTHPCPACEESFAETRNLVKHLMAAHSGDHVFKCPVCGKGFMKEKDLAKHQAKNHGNSLCLPGLGSENSCKEKPSSIKHKRLHLNPETLPCATYEGNGGVERPLTCGHCGKSYKQEKAFLNHQSVCVRPQPSGEGKAPKEDGPLTKNQITYVEMKDNTCFDCGKPVCKSSLLASQPKGDQEKRLQVCPECGESFRDSQGFGLGEKTPPVCRGCRRDYSTHYNLRRHQRIHVECRHKCTFCGKTKCSLDKHQKTHKGEKPFCCSYCGRRVTTSTILRYHQRTHTGERPYKCTRDNYFKKCG